MLFDSNQLAVSVLAVLAASSICAVFIFERKARSRVARRWAFALLCACSVAAMVSWFRFGAFHGVFLDADPTDVSPVRHKIESHQPFHFDEFFHYYLGSKYFGEIGYLGLYDCTTLVDREIAVEDHVPPRITGYVRDLEDVLRDRPANEAIHRCETVERPRFSTQRWSAFKTDVRELRRLVPDGWWNGIVRDAGFNPPPSWIVVASAVANVIPIWWGTVPTYLFATSLDVLLLVACFSACRSAFGTTVAVLASIYFGASFIGSYGWNGGAFLRFTWIASVIFGLAALKRERWLLAGCLFGLAACDRVFPAAFAFGAVIPIAHRALRSPGDRKALVRFVSGAAATTAVLVAASAAVFGLAQWAVFFVRILKHGDVYYVMHIGLKKVLTFRDWVPSQNFRDHDGMLRFHDWNLRLRATWAQMQPVAVTIQLLVVLGVVRACVRRRPFEAAVLCGVATMFFFNLPANYYYAILSIVPALLFRASATASSEFERMRNYVLLVAFNVFWTFTLISSRVWSDDIVYDYYICLSLGLFLLFWIAAWLDVDRATLRRVAWSLRSLGVGKLRSHSRVPHTPA